MKILLNPELVEESYNWRSRSSKDIQALIDNIQLHLNTNPKKITFIGDLDKYQDTEYHDSIVYALSSAYSLHRSLRLTPHDIWYIILSELSTLVNSSPTKYRSIFTKSPDKIQLLVPTDAPHKLPLELIEKELRKNVPVDMDMFLLPFSTHTEMSRIATMAAFAGMVKQYYSYVTFLCGIRELDIAGTVDDWQLILDRIENFKTIFGNLTPILIEWFERIQNRVTQIINSLKGGDQEFYQTIFSSSKIGSGGQLKVDGWFVQDFFKDFGGDMPKLSNIPNSWSVVPFENLETGRKFSSVYGCFKSNCIDGIWIPDYDSITFEHYE